ncbi:MAG TPA: dihydrolipoamide acetyltransferase family protein [Candidatus Tectomicrobia bacterium]|nr:dihydrolipoamide acetyltransferase family protein [Candidatus Tectomicrobia bacterium]
MAEFRMPSLGADMEAGTLVEWKVKPGDRLKRGDIIAEVETDKGIIEIEVFEDGIVEQILVQPDIQVPVGTVLAMIRPTSALAAPTMEMPAEPLAQRVTEERGPVVRPPRVTAPVTAPGKRLRASPLARKLAAELGVDLSSVQGSGPDGAIERVDVERVAATRVAVEQPTAPGPVPPSPPPQPAPPRAPTPEAPPVLVKPEVPEFQLRMRRAIAGAMARSNREIPHYYLETRLDMSRALRWLEAENQQRSIKERILPVVLLIKAVARALGDVPELNGYWIDDRLQPQEAIHIGFAISLRQGGLVIPAIHHADLKTLDELMEGLRDLIPRVRSGRLRSSELTDATITLTNLGDLGVEVVYGVIYPPQVALVGFGKITEQPWAENGMLAVRPVLSATLAGDHRATDGHRGAQFLESLNRRIQEPAQL